MLLLAKITAIALMIWFFITGKENNENPVKWAVIGVMGYWITWAAFYFTVVPMFNSMVGKNGTLVFLVVQIPVILGLIAAFFIRKKLILDANRN